ncbi:MAG: hypothetical protein MJY61_02665 [Bacteroidales bacterium]|nr:hypothetical protein [Bacteroidales bacterium]
MKSSIMTVVAVAAAIFFTASASAETRYFTKTRGDKFISTMTISEKSIPGGFEARFGEGNKYEIHTMNSARMTTALRIVNPEKDTDVTVTLKDGLFHFKGKVRGKNVDKTEKSSGDPWYQNPEINGLKFLKGKKDFRIQVIRPTEVDRFTLKSTDKGTETIDGFTVTHIVNTNVGAFAGAWKCSYCFDVNTNEFVLYKSVEGAPGTPETKIVIKK